VYYNGSNWVFYSSDLDLTQPLINSNYYPVGDYLDWGTVTVTGLMNSSSLGPCPEITTTTTSSSSSTSTTTSTSSTTTTSTSTSTTTTTTTVEPTTTTTTTFGACTEFVADGSDAGGTVDYVDCDSNPVSLPVALGEISAPFCGLLGSVTTNGPIISIIGTCPV
jgi:hypothetical protein